MEKQGSYKEKADKPSFLGSLIDAQPSNILARLLLSVPRKIFNLLMGRRPDKRK